MKGAFLILPWLACLVACDFPPRLSADSAALTGESPRAPVAADCSSCHQYPLHDVHHGYHLLSPNANHSNLGQDKLNGAMTCLDCHFNSIRHFSFPFYDSIWVDADGNEYHVRIDPSYRLARVDTRTRFRPVFALRNPRPGESLATFIDTLVLDAMKNGKIVQWLTDFAHNDGKVEVVFAPNNVTSPELLATAYRPADLSCSAIECHGRPEAVYRWPSAERGLSGCPSVEGNDTSCGEPSR